MSTLTLDRSPSTSPVALSVLKALLADFGKLFSRGAETRCSGAAEGAFCL